MLNKEAPPVSRRGRFSNCPNYRVIMQQAPGQQAPPPQQLASLDENEVALARVIIAAIKSKYFMISPVEIFVKPRPRGRAGRVLHRAEPESWERIRFVAADSAAVRSALKQSHRH
jgi:hypothetical protein